MVNGTYHVRFISRISKYSASQGGKSSTKAVACYDKSVARVCCLCGRDIGCQIIRDNLPGFQEPAVDFAITADTTGIGEAKVDVRNPSR